MTKQFTPEEIRRLVPEKWLQEWCISELGSVQVNAFLITRAQLEVAVGALNRISAGQMETWENIVSKEALAKINEMRGE